jgi:hypothetical protein
MLDILSERPDPIFYFVIVFPATLVALALGYLYAYRYGKTGSDKAGWAFGLGQAAIFGLIALILGFSFSYAAGRFEARSALVVDEASSIWSTYLRAGFLPPKTAISFRKILVDYTTTRLRTYAEVRNMHSVAQSLARGRVLQGQLWGIASSAARRNFYYMDLTRSVIETIGVSDRQEAALNNHVPRAIIGIIFLSTIVGAFLLGLTFGRAKAPNPVLAIIFCLLFAATVFTIIDLDHPQGGFIGVDVAPLRDILSDMTNAPESHLMRTPVTTRSEGIPSPP